MLPTKLLVEWSGGCQPYHLSVRPKLNKDAIRGNKHDWPCPDERG
jgi:hypothetical protein